MIRAASLSSVLALVPALLGAQSAPPPAGAQGTEQELPEILRPRDPSPLLDPKTLQARQLLGLRAEVAALILRGEAGGGIGVAALAVPLPAEAAPAAEEPAAAVAAPKENPAGETARGEGEAAPPPAIRVPLQLLVEVDGASFLNTNTGDVARLEVYAYALDEAGGVAGHLGEAFAVDVGGLGEAIWQGGLKFFGRLGAAPGRYRLRVLVRNAQSGAGGLTEVPLVVPDPAAAPPPAPLFRGPAGRDAWIPVRAWGGGPHEPEPSYPFVAGGEAVNPAALPVLTAGRAADALVFGAVRATNLRLELRPSEGDAPAIPLPAETASAAGVAPLELRFVVPEVPAGEYRIATVGDDSPGRPVLVVADDSGERSLLWTDLRWRLGGTQIAEGGGAAEIAQDAPRGRRGRRGAAAGGRRGRRAAEQYRDALSGLAEGGGEAISDERWRAVRAAVFELQSSSLGEGRGGSLGSLQAGTMTVARQLAEAQPESLPPLMRLHEELYGDYRGRKVFSLASYNRLMVEALAELYAASGGTPQLAADALVSLGGYLQEANLPSTASRLFRRALAVDPENAEARLALAALYERHGAPRKAAEQLSPVVDTRPQHLEAKLRLALNLSRSGDRRQARVLLGQVAASSGPAWLRALAVQELARQDLQRGNPEAAAGRIEPLLAELPGDLGLRLLLANAYDRLKRPREALDVVDAVRPSATESPRRRYDGWPRAALEDVRGRLDQAASDRREQLAAGLGASR